MPNIASSIRQVRTDEKRTARNKSARTEVKSVITKAEKLIAAGKLDEAKTAVAAAAATLDKAGNKGVLHKNNTSRRKANLVAKLNKANKK